MISKYVELKKALITKKLIQDPSIVPVQVDELEAIKRIKLTIEDAVKRIETDHKNDTDVANYFRLLFVCQDIYLRLHTYLYRSSIMTGNLALAGLDSSLKTILNHDSDNKLSGTLKDVSVKPVDKADILFVQLYNISKEVFDVAEINPIRERLTSGQNDATRANIELVNLSYEKILTESDPNNITKLAQIIMAHKINRTDDISNMHYIFNPQYNAMSMEDFCYYEAQEKKDPNYKLFEGLKSLSKYELRKNISGPMNHLLDELVKESNILYRDKKVDAVTKDNCNTLLKSIAGFRDDIAKIREVQHFSPSPQLTETDEEFRLKNIPPSHDVVALKVSVRDKAEAIRAQIETLNTTTMSKNWKRILICAICSVGFGLIAIAISFARNGTFFKKEHPIVTQARELVKQAGIDVEPPPATEVLKGQVTGSTVTQVTPVKFAF